MSLVLEYVIVGGEVLLRVHGSWNPDYDGERPPLTLLVEQHGSRSRLVPLPSAGALNPNDVPAGSPWRVGYRAPARVIEEGPAAFFLEVGVDRRIRLPEPVEYAGPDAPRQALTPPTGPPAGREERRRRRPRRVEDITDWAEAERERLAEAERRLDVVRDEAREADARARAAWIRVDALQEKIDGLERDLADAVERAASAEARAADTEASAAEAAEQRVKEAEKQARAAAASATQAAEQRVEEAKARAHAADDWLAGAERRAEEALARLEAAEERAEAAHGRAAEAEAHAASFEPRMAEAAERVERAEQSAHEAGSLLAVYQERLEEAEAELRDARERAGHWDEAAELIEELRERLAAEERQARSQRELAHARSQLAAALFGPAGGEGGRASRRLAQLVQRQAAVRRSHEGESAELMPPADRDEDGLR